jgi:hypothetical protein
MLHHLRTPGAPLPCPRPLPPFTCTHAQPEGARTRAFLPPPRAPLRRPGRRGAGLHTDGPGAKGRGPPVPAGPAQLCGAAPPLLGSRANPLARRLHMREGGAPIPADPAQLRGEGGTCRPPPSWRINGGEGGLWPPFACPARRGRARTAHVGRAPQFATRAKRESSPLCTRGEPGGRGAHWGARTFRAPPPPFRMPHRGRMRAERGGGGESPPLQCVCKAGALPLCTCGKPGGEGAHYGAAWQRGRARAKGRGRTLRAPPRVSRLSHPLPFRMPHRGRARAERGKGEPPHFAARAKRGAPSLHVWRTGGRGRALRAATGEGEGKGGVLFAPRPAPPLSHAP